MAQNMELRWCGAMNNFSRAVDRALSSLFGWLGKLVAFHPRIVILSTLALTAAFCVIGFFHFELEDAPSNLYVPENAETLLHDYEKLYHTHGLPLEEKILVYSKEGDHVNLLASPRESIGELMDMWDTMMGPIEDGVPFSPVRAMCDKPRHGAKCKVTSILAAWDFNRTLLNDDPDPLKTLNSGPLHSYGISTSFETVLGGIQRDADGQIIGAAVFANYLALDDNPDLTEKFKLGVWLLDERVDKELRQRIGNTDFSTFLYSAMLDQETAAIMEGWENRENSTLRARMTNLNVVWDSSDNAIFQDLLWAGLAGGLVVIACMIVLWRSNRIECKSHLVLPCGLAIIMGLLCGFGCGLLFGFSFNLVAAAVPTLIIGLGVDDTFIIVGHYRRTDPDLSPEERVSVALSTSGPSIFVTSITDLIALLVTANSSIPALQAFGVFAGLGVAFDFLYQVTFFVAFLVWEAKREHHLCTKMKVDRTLSGSILKEPNGIPANYSTVDNDANTTMESQGQDPPSNAVPNPGTSKASTSHESIYAGIVSACTSFGSAIPSMLVTAWGTAAVVVVEFALITWAIYGCTNVVTDFRYKEWFSPKGSWIHDGLRLENKFFLGDQSIVGIYTTEGSHFYHQKQMWQCIKEFESSAYVATSPKSHSWYKDFVVWSRQHHTDALSDGLWIDNSATFVELVKVFLKSPDGAFYFGDVKFNAEQTQILTSKLLSVSTKNLPNSTYGIEVMDNFRTISEVNIPLLHPVVFHDLFLFYEGLKIIKKDTLTNLLLAGSVVLIVIVLLAKFVAAFLVSLAVALTGICLIGFMWYAGLTFNMVTSICIILSVGLSVDYSVHIAHNFLVQIGTRKDRIIAAMNNIGGDVLCGAATSLLAMLGLAATQTYVMQVFFKMLSVLIVFGAWHGIIVLPILLKLIGPSSYGNQLPPPNSV